MLVKDQKKDLKIKVEEIKENPPKKEDKDSSILIPPKITSFSQLDTLRNQEEKEESSNDSSKTPEAKVKEKLDEDLTSQEKVPDQTTEKKDFEKTQLSSEEVKRWLQEVRPDTTKEIEKGAGINVKLIIVLIASFMILGAIAGGVFYYKKGISKRKVITSEPKIETPTPLPTITEQKVDLKKLSVNVLNGSGKRGEAAKVKELLTSFGFDSVKIKTGNASSYDYKQTNVSLKDSFPESVFEAVKNSLSDYEVVKSEEQLKEDSEFDIIIIVGSEKK